MSATPSTSPKRLPRDPVADESEDELDDEYIQEQLDATMWSDLKKSFWDSRFAAPIFALLGFLLAYHLTIAPYRTNPVDQENRNAITDLSMVRPVISEEIQKHIQQIMLRQENVVELPEAIGGSFTMRFVPHVDKHGTRELPDMFYQGVMFGVSSANSHKVEYSRLQPDRTSKALYDELLSMQPKPTHVLRRYASCNNTDWTEKGYGVYFSYADLEAQGMLSSDKLQPWKRVLDPMLWTARKFKQVYLTVWYPHQFGEHAEDPATSTVYPRRLHKHTNIIQTVIPTRTGLDRLRSTAAVWLMERNNTPVVTPPRMYRDPAVLRQQEQYVSVENF